MVNSTNKKEYHPSLQWVSNSTNKKEYPPSLQWVSNSTNKKEYHPSLQWVSNSINKKEYHPSLQWVSCFQRPLHYLAFKYFYFERTHYPDSELTSLCMLSGESTNTNSVVFSLTGARTHNHPRCKLNDITLKTLFECYMKNGD